MRRALLLLAIIAALPAYAIDISCDPAVTQLSALYEIRAVMMRGSSYDVDRLIDRRLEQLRDPLPGGGYRWVKWVRPGGEGPVDKQGHSVVAVHDRGDSDSFEASSEHVYAVRVVVPRKRSLLNGNNPVYVGTVLVTYSSGNSRPKTKTLDVNQWMNPDTSKSIDLETIADHVDASLNASTAEKNTKEALVELHFRQAVAQDDPANPGYDAIQTLKRIRSYSDPATVDSEIAAAERKLFPDSEPVPVLTILHDLREADRLMQSKKEDEQKKGVKLLADTMRRLR